MAATLTAAMMTYFHSRDVVRFTREFLGFMPDDAQCDLLSTQHRRVILNCRRQWGKSTMAAIFALHRAMLRDEQRVVLISPTMRHELAAKCRSLGRKAGLTLGTDATNPRSIVLSNGSMILPLPANADFVRGFTAHMLIVDEAARVNDEVMTAATPMLATTDGDLWLLSTPKGKRGLFYEVWKGDDVEWLRIEGKTSSAAGRESLLAFSKVRRSGRQARSLRRSMNVGLPPPNEMCLRRIGLKRHFARRAGF